MPGLTDYVSDSLPAPNLPQATEASVFNPAAIREFTPQNYDIGNTVIPLLQFPWRRQGALANTRVEYRQWNVTGQWTVQ